MNANSTCLVLGGCGFIGLNLVEQLLGEGYSVRVFDRPDSNRQHLHPGVDFCGGDFLNDVELGRALEGVDFVFHLVGTTLPANSNSCPAFDIRSNVVGTIRLLELCVQHKVRRIVLSSSGGTVYGDHKIIPIPEEHPTDPLCSYGIAKLAIEKYLQIYRNMHGLEYTVLRIANPYGRYQKLTAGQGAIGVFLGRMRDGKKITVWGDGSVVRDYVYVQDVARAFVKALTQNSPYRIFNLGTGRGLSLRDLIGELRQITGIEPELEYAPSRSVDVSVNILDPTRAHKHMDWRAEIDHCAGLRKTWSWICETKQLAQEASATSITG
jgi:UDP-glucose 4-epimerase